MFSLLSSFFLFLFLLLLPTQLGKHFFMDFSYLSGSRIDYLAPTLYATDILVFALVLLNIKTVVRFFQNKLILLGITLLLVNVYFSLSPVISLIKFVKIVELCAVFSIIKARKIHPGLFMAVITLGTIGEFVLVVLQFVSKHSLQGIFYWFGERYFTLSTPDIAKMSLQGIEFLRPYGTFSHPNSMGGFYLLLYTLVLVDKRLSPYFLRKILFLTLASLLILFSFSKIVIVMFFIINIIYLFIQKKKWCKLCLAARLIALIALSALFLSAKGDVLTVDKRITLVSNSFSIIASRPLTGTGLGAYLIAQHEFPIKYNYVFLQPVHNIFLLFFSELGIIIGGIVGYIGLRFLKERVVFKISKKGLRRILNHAGVLCLLVIGVTGFFDHYWLTLQQNMLLIPVVLAFISD